MIPYEHLRVCEEIIFFETANKYAGIFNEVAARPCRIGEIPFAVEEYGIPRMRWHFFFLTLRTIDYLANDTRMITQVANQICITCTDGPMLIDEQFCYDRTFIEIPFEECIFIQRCSLLIYTVMQIEIIFDIQANPLVDRPEFFFVSRKRSRQFPRKNLEIFQRMIGIKRCNAICFDKLF